ncbi:hypothetical protein MMC29_005231 [Sticta canariensis]|nr:hypothetical protein [Sticta canariensis]
MHHFLLPCIGFAARGLIPGHDMAGVASWTWYYPYHYAPFASDLTNLGAMQFTFQKGDPFKPFNQLMGVLPAASAHALPPTLQPLFTAADSSILDFYPSSFALDMNGKRFAWQAVALLPFIDEQRLLSATAALEHMLTDEEKWRNSRRIDQIYLLSSHAMAPDVFELEDAAAGKAEEDRGQLCKPLEAGVTGMLSFMPQRRHSHTCFCWIFLQADQSRAHTQMVHLLAVSPMRVQRWRAHAWAPPAACSINIVLLLPTQHGACVCPVRLVAAGGMSGFLLPASGEACPAVVPAPFALGEDVAGNSVCCACYRDPPEQVHVARPLPGQMFELTAYIAPICLSMVEGLAAAQLVCLSEWSSRTCLAADALTWMCLYLVMVMVLPSRWHPPVTLMSAVAAQESVVTEADIQATKPLWHEDRPGPGRPYDISWQQNGPRPHALADSAHRMVQHAVRAAGLHPAYGAAGSAFGSAPGLHAHAHAHAHAQPPAYAPPHAHLQHRPQQVGLDIVAVQSEHACTCAPVHPALCCLRKGPLPLPGCPSDKAQGSILHGQKHSSCCPTSLLTPAAGGVTAGAMQDLPGAHAPQWPPQHPAAPALNPYAPTFQPRPYAPPGPGGWQQPPHQQPQQYGYAPHAMQQPAGGFNPYAPPSQPPAMGAYRGGYAAAPPQAAPWQHTGQALPVCWWLAWANQLKSFLQHLHTSGCEYRLQLLFILASVFPAWSCLQNGHI